jgi:oligoribonuclease (3'-5' exoribonuclease)
MEDQLRKTTYVVLDLETEGLDPTKDQILEVAAIAVSRDLEPLARHHAVIHSSRPREEIDPYVQRMHEGNGLFAESAASSINELSADVALGRFLSTLYHGPGAIVLMGNSVHFDHGFLRARFPVSATWLHYRLMDIGGLARWLKDFGAEFEKPEIAHRAMLDCESELREAQKMRAFVRSIL